MADTDYFARKLGLIIRDIAQYTGPELGTELRRLADVACVDEENAKLRDALQRISDTALGHPYAGVTCGEIAREALGVKEFANEVR